MLEGGHKVWRSRLATVTWLTMSQQTVQWKHTRAWSWSARKKCPCLRVRTVASHSCDCQPELTGHMAAETFRSVRTLTAHFCCCISADRSISKPTMQVLYERSLYFCFTLQDLLERHLNAEYIPCQYPVWILNQSSQGQRKCQSMPWLL